MSTPASEIVGVTDWNDRVIEITPVNLEAGLRRAEEWFTQGKIDGLSLRGFDGVSISFLDRVRYISFLDIQRCSKLDLAPVLALTKLLELRIGSGVTDRPVNVAPLGELRLLSADWGKGGVVSLTSLERLETLILHGCKARDLTSLQLPGSIVDFRLILGTLEALDGIERLARLRRGRFWLMPKLVNVEAIGALREMEVLEMENLKRVSSFAAIGSCTKLRELFIEKCAPVSTLAWLENLRDLQKLSVADTPIDDGDFSVVSKLPKLIDFAATRNKRYFPPIRDIEKLVASRRQAMLNKSEA